MSDQVEKFSEIGDRYGEQLARGLSVTGESAEYFARARVARMRAIITQRRWPATTILDFGCGTGATLPVLRAAFPDARIIGFEPAAGLRDQAFNVAAGVGAEVLDFDLLALDAEADVVYCNGVFHHIEPRLRRAPMASLARAMKPKAAFFAWENSPFNPGTRWVMSRIPFDRDAKLLTPFEMGTLQRNAGMRQAGTEFHFVFPHALSALRFLEPAMRGLPFGGQYVVIGVKNA